MKVEEPKFLKVIKCVCLSKIILIAYLLAVLHRVGFWSFSLIKGKGFPFALYFSFYLIPPEFGHS